MKINVLFFGILKDIVKKSTLEIEVAENATTDVLKTSLLQRYDGLQQFSNFSIAVNEEYADANYVLQNNDVVALIPPVSGG